MCASLTLYFIVFIHKCNSILFDQLSCTSNYLQIIESIEMLKELYLSLDGIEGFFFFSRVVFRTFSYLRKRYQFSHPRPTQTS